MADLEVRELRYFRAVAEELNFSRAAERLGMAQPPLSRAIRQLERRLGARLFERDNRKVVLTAAGHALREEADLVLEAVSAAAHRTRRAAHIAPSLVVTTKSGVATELLRDVTAAFTALPDTPEVRIVLSGYGEQADMVRDGRADVAVLGSPLDRRRLDLEPLIEEPRVAALPAGHELADHAELSVSDLAGQTWPACEPASAAEVAYWTGMDGAAPTATRPPVATGPVVRDSSQLIEVVALGQAVALIPASMAERNIRADIVYRPVPDASHYTLALAWRRGSRAPWIARFVRTATELVSARNERFETVAEIA